MPHPDTPTSYQRAAVPIWLLTAVWIAAIIVGYTCLISYNMTSGQTLAAPVSWPKASEMPHDSELPTLLVFIHPKCPCTQATIQELEKLLGETRGSVRCRMLFVCPSRLVPSWMDSRLARYCSSIEGADLDIDIDGALASMFNATASGQCLLYSARGELLFEGGITSERGHIGESIGRDAIRKIVRHDPAYIRCSPVFGCELVQLHRNYEAESFEFSGAQ